MACLQLFQQMISLRGREIVDVLFFFFNDTATTEIYTLSLHDALPIFHVHRVHQSRALRCLKMFLKGLDCNLAVRGEGQQDRKSTRLNSSHSQISYAVFCLKKKKKYTMLLYCGCSLTTHISPPARPDTP